MSLKPEYCSYLTPDWDDEISFELTSKQELRVSFSGTSLRFFQHSTDQFGNSPKGKLRKIWKPRYAPNWKPKAAE